jgi:hypothetical protein
LVLVDTDTLAELAHSSTRDEFVAKLPHCFLVIEGSLDDHESVGFSTRIVDPVAAKRMASAPRNANLEALEIIKAPGNPYPDRVSIGRARNCDVVMRDPSVSKLHAHFRVGQGKLEIVDNDSQNGTRVNGRSLPANEAVGVEVGDVILIGNVSTRLVDAYTLYDLLK